MSDAERDAWLRQALRHAPDADATPPRGVSETILAQARAAARQGAAQAGGSRRGRNPVAALWDWLARPPVAAGFASVMAATLVGLMWWDRPLDEAMPRPPKPSSERAQAPSTSDATGRAAMPSRSGVDAAGSVASLEADAAPQRADADARAAAPATPAAPAIPDLAAAPATPPSRRSMSDGAAANNQKMQAPEAKAEAPAGRAQAPAAPAQPRDAKVQPAEAKEQRKLETTAEVARGERAAAKPAAFPHGDDARANVAAEQPSVAKKKDSALNDRAVGAATADALSPRDAPAAKSSPAAATPAPGPVAPAGALRSPPPTSTRQRADEAARLALTPSGDADLARRAPPAMVTIAPAAPPPATPTTAPTAPAPTTTAAPAMRGGVTAESSEKQASAFGSAPPAAQSRNEIESAQREPATSPLAPALAAIASDPARWSRSTTSGSVVALDAGWRDWLTQLDVAARERWQRSVDAADRERDGAVTLRLVAGGRTAAVVRLDGTTVRVDALDRGERWQATLPAGVAERLRATAERLGP